MADRNGRRRSGGSPAVAASLAAIAAALAAGGGTAANAQSLYDVRFQSATPLTGRLLFDLTNGDGAANNAATVVFADSFGAFTFAETDPSEILFTESRAVSGITSFSFTLNLSENFAGGSPDQFAFYFYDDAEAGPVVRTDDPSEAHALFAIDITGTPFGSLQTFSPSTPGVFYTVTPVPEPGAPAVAGAMLGTLGLVLLRRRRRLAVTPMR